MQGLRHATLPIHGVQFHPESIASEHGHALLANFLELARARRSRRLTAAETFLTRSAYVPSGGPDMLTRKQHELLLYIDARLVRDRRFALVRGDEGGARPQVEERRPPPHLGAGGARLHPPAGESGARAGSAEDARDEGRRRRGAGAPAAPPRAANDILDIPLHGRIAAGTPIEALQGTDTLPVPAALLGPGEHYALEVAGNSMVDEGILDGDYALIRRQDTARDGEIVVALINNEEATLKTFRREGQMIRLDPGQPPLRPAALPARAGPDPGPAGGAAAALLKGLTAMSESASTLLPA